MDSSAAQKHTISNKEGQLIYEFCARIFSINMKATISKFKIALIFSITLSLLFLLLSTSYFSESSKSVQNFDCWIWSKNDHPLKHQCEHFYVFQGRFYSNQGQASFEKLGLYTKAVNSSAIHSLVFRVDDLVDEKFIVHHIKNVMKHWRNAGSNIESVQIDYDSSSRTLNEYAVFLSKLTKLWPEMRFSATALVSWHADNFDGLMKVSEQVDYLAFQLYQVMKPHKNYEKMSAALSSFPDPYRLGITTHNSFVIDDIVKGKNFLGFSLFLGKSNVN